MAEIAGVVLMAEHSSYTSTPHEALQKAIDKATEILKRHD
jgi:hypothetical protein